MGADTIDMRVEPMTVQRQAVEKLRAAILSGEYAPGARLAEAQLCERLGISRPSVREALRSLEAEKLILMLPNKGPQVAKLSWAEAQAIYDVRTLLEGEAAARFVTHGTAGHLAAMRRALTAFDAAVRRKDILGRLSTTGDFYAAILQGCGNPIIQEVLQGLNARISFLRAQSMSRASRPAHSGSEMRAILDAIESGDAEAARRAASEHVANACASAAAAQADL
jgi:DNA-binding GntR family transcriptional regulator